MSTVYSHPDGGSIELDGTTLTIIAENGHTASVQIGPSGLRELANKFNKNAHDFETAMHLEGLGRKEVLAFDSHSYATAEQVDNAKAPSTRGWRHSAGSQAQCRRTSSTPSKNTSDHSVRCITTSNAGTPASCLKYRGNRPQAM